MANKKETPRIDKRDADPADYSVDPEYRIPRAKKAGQAAALEADIASTNEAKKNLKKIMDEVDHKVKEFRKSVKAFDDKDGTGDRAPVQASLTDLLSEIRAAQHWVQNFL